ncbi:hypothetical protein EXIGLDRAFT_754611 [Exidia glandulosa HHB12029]|uniref:Uncharacterized protein n=1 Tax=Exidia glandulosa HHB12029 TaxID=1314781 RepID=A0A165CT89_EXIGL|nr:hypothetical protein EXIGLDRAFT_754611 [Exidia glandulosa HHB12029]
MPEWRECYAHYLYVLRRLEAERNAFFSLTNTSDGPTEMPMRLRSLWIDATQKEFGTGPASVPLAARNRFRNMQAYPLDFTTRVVRGGSSATRVWPEGIRNLSNLELGGVHFSPRALVLDLGPRWLTFRYLTHTSVAVMSAGEWEVLRDIPQSGRHFKIALALEFDLCAIVFQSHDMLYQAEWSSEPPDIAPYVCPPLDDDTPEYPDNFPYWDHFLEFMEMRLSSRSARNGLAMSIIQQFEEFFPGIGVYSCSEIFVKAGLPHTLTEAELFDNPSRTARFLEAYYDFAHRALADLWTQVIQPALHNGSFIAPTVDQRLRAARDWFVAWAKDMTRVSSRLGQLHDAATNMNSFDVFEPIYIRRALSKQNHLAHLIFGHDASNFKDPITEHFRARALLDAPTFLDPTAYGQLFPAQQSVRYLHVWAYRQAGKTVWSLTPPCKNRKTCLLPSDTRPLRLFKYIVTNTNKVAVGPLEYCGNAIYVSHGGSQRIAMCKGDPLAFPVASPESDWLTRHILGQARRRALRAMTGYGKESVGTMRLQVAKLAEELREGRVSGRTAARMKKRLDALKRGLAFIADGAKAVRARDKVKLNVAAMMSTSSNTNNSNPPSASASTPIRRRVSAHTRLLRDNAAQGVIRPSRCRTNM